MKERKYRDNLILSVARSLYDATAYAALAMRPTAHAVIYLLVFSLVCASIAAIPVARKIDVSLERAGRYFRTDFPDFVFTPEGFNAKGRLPVISIDEERFIWVFDPSGKTDHSILNDYPRGIYLSNEGVLYKKNEIETRHYSLDALKQYAPIAKRDVERLISYHWVLTAAITAFILVFSVLAKYLSALFVALIGLAGFALAQRQVPFNILFRLSMYSLTLPIIIKTASSATEMDIPWFFIIYYGIAVFYLIRGVGVIRTLPPEG
ncbi:MAG TPA: DUF1189 domain-containing protein [Spirochaetota bacterium]|nr:DUF1189 domain-containing protein [Spirochaetota bacterium]HNU92900.1 DUF1189 domain-containing protein [Spirochaetota bacterium]HPV99188.1 DUF1189 domain-containing protein [Spirochaetota bacterium]